MLTASTSDGYSLLFKLLADAGDEVLVPRPSYPLFDHLTRLDLVVTRATTISSSTARGRSTSPASSARSRRAPAPCSSSAPTTRPARSSPRASSIGSRRSARRAASRSSPTRCSPTTSSSRARPLARAACRRGDDVLVVRARRPVEVGRPAAGEARMDCGRRSRAPGGRGARAARVDLRHLPCGVDAGAARCGESCWCTVPRCVHKSRHASSRITVRCGERSTAVPACRVLPADGGWYAVVQVPSLESGRGPRAAAAR